MDETCFKWTSAISYAKRGSDQVWKLIQEQIWISIRLGKVFKLQIKLECLFTDWQCDYGNRSQAEKRLCQSETKTM